MNKLLNSYKQKQLRKGEIHKIALNACKTLEKRESKVTNLAVSKEIKRSYRQVVRIMKTLEKRNLIKIIKPSVNIGGRRYSAIYSVCKS